LVEKQGTFSAHKPFIKEAAAVTVGSAPACWAEVHDEHHLGLAERIGKEACRENRKGGV
jgi:hypothetical protein